MGKLDELLKQREDISNYLESLIEIHKDALSDGSDGSQLDTVRNHISICFSDLQKINEKLISHNGILKNEMSKLMEIRREVLELSTKEIELLKEKFNWSFDPTISSGVTHNDVTKFIFETHYRDDMNKYIELVGITNTSLARDKDEDKREKQERFYSNETSDGTADGNVLLTRDDTLKCMTYLHNASTTANKDIKALEALLKNMKKDQSFLGEEMKIQTSKIKSIKNRILNDLEKIHKRTETILREIDLKIPNQPQLKDKELYKLANEDSIDDLIQLAREKVELEIEFIDIKKDAYAQMLKEFKVESSNLKARHELWGDCLEEVISLEKKVKHEIARKGSNPVIPTDLIEIIQVSIEHLQELQILNNDKRITTLIGDEKDTLSRACQELRKQVQTR
ncbi:similar to Saccharomyces cerevisiae YLR431C ATG23 Peripheral membrane protein required for the cytoplasm-to-vacuole targeting (Cvt) pathway and efficient macroautophagy [Maudiozyma saulgeensis]|uniref:Similar to Saccharomyces cerevisiae YLR431C ATG23 Peripheral membrane protein required for the cytoplasm-to-vacuole targeting (Cvt) pathway and efficient macroautophagy n=1 Tax=Maudiozyma saulgeensis TaxID=1789683 RepID=A0A1X7R8M3_9SACH|nr:similar to Saccharomyces cerevisiae YLR431C ATG23 Peripheral membrane protein required for the cytoplasm-to-vacuole targeting (Cvt) pathway and efficient macroautophagy [Kazachstania saulgeensis]